MNFSETVSLYEIEKPEKIFLASTSLVKVTPTENCALQVFGNAVVIGVKVESGVSENPYAANETLIGALNRCSKIKEQTSNESATQFIAIENGIFPTKHLNPSFMYLFQLSEEASIQNLDNIEQLSIFMQQCIQIDTASHTNTNIEWDNSPLALNENTLEINDSNVKFYDRAVIVTRDEITGYTFIGISRGVEFPRQEVVETIGEKAGSVRTADVIKRNLYEQGIINENGIILSGKLTGEMFNVQDPQRYLTEGNYSREQQISDIEKALFSYVKSARSTN